MTTRTELLNFLIGRYGFKSYLEIGVQYPPNNFDQVLAEIKVGVDPEPAGVQKRGILMKMTSDEAFRKIERTFDLIFIDGLHHADQARKDFFNADQILNPGGFIVMHDCNPDKEELTHVPRDSKIWYGDVYKFAAQFAGNPDFMTVDIDCGCGVFKKSQNHRITGEEITWKYFDKNRRRLLNMVSADEFIQLHA